MSFDVLVGGEYRLLLEPIAYYRFRGSMIATTATEAALYDEQLSGGLRSRMVSLTHKNLPIAMFLETADLGYPAWNGSRTSAATNSEIKSSLGLGIVRFEDALPDPPEIHTFDYEYRTNTEVITAVEVKGGQSDPDNPVSVIFDVGGRIYTVENVYYPEGDSQLAWIRWTTPEEAQTMTITVEVEGGGTPCVLVRFDEADTLLELANAADYRNLILDTNEQIFEEQIALFTFFFGTPLSDESRWNFIEDYFTGMEVDALIKKYKG